MKTIITTLFLASLLAGCMNLLHTPAEMRSSADGHIEFATTKNYETTYRNIVNCARGEWENRLFRVHGDLFPDGTASITVGAFGAFMSGLLLQIDIKGSKENSQTTVYYLNDAWKAKTPMIKEWAESGDKQCTAL